MLGHPILPPIFVQPACSPYAVSLTRASRVKSHKPKLQVLPAIPVSPGPKPRRSTITLDGTRFDPIPVSLKSRVVLHSIRGRRHSELASTISTYFTLLQPNFVAETIKRQLGLSDLDLSRVPTRRSDYLRLTWQASEFGPNYEQSLRVMGMVLIKTGCMQDPFLAEYSKVVIDKLTSLAEGPLTEVEAKMILLTMTQMRAMIPVEMQEQPSVCQRIVSSVTSFHRGQAVFCECKEVQLRRAIAFDRDLNPGKNDLSDDEFKKLIQMGGGFFYTCSLPHEDKNTWASRISTAVKYEWTGRRNVVVSTNTSDLKLVGQSAGVAQGWVGVIAPQAMLREESGTFSGSGGERQFLATKATSDAVQQCIRTQFSDFFPAYSPPKGPLGVQKTA